LAGDDAEVVVRILVTNDDGVRAPGIAALAGAAQRSGHDVVVVAPLIDYSGAGAAVGPVHSRDGVDYETHRMDGVDVPAYGIDGPPALAVILACVGGFGPKPDLVLSGINHGANVGRSALHSGTVGAALTAAQFGLPALAVSIRYGEPPIPWETATQLVDELIPLVADAEPATVLSLNVPDVFPSGLRGVRAGLLGRSGTIRSAVHHGASPPDAPWGDADTAHIALPPGPSGTMRLDLSPPWESPEADITTDAGLVANNFASLTALSGVRATGGPAADVVAAALARWAAGAGAGAEAAADPGVAGGRSGP
jgi:5'-nucleotidase